MEILSFKLKSKTNSNIFVVETNNGEYIFHSETIVKFSLAKGLLEDEKFFKAKQESDELIALSLAMKYVSSNLKTEKQIKDYLYKKEFEKSIVDSVVEKLKEYKVVDDKSFADMYVKSNPSFSKRKVQQKLSSFGVKKDLTEELIDQVDDEESCLKNAQKFMRGKVLDVKTHEKLIRRLIYLGYNWETIRRTLNKLNIETEE